MDQSTIIRFDDALPLHAAPRLDLYGPVHKGLRAFMFDTLGRLGRCDADDPAELERTLAARKDERPEGSYTVELLDDPELIGAKIREEADEVARAIAGESDERVAEEAADVLYHLEVGMLSRDVPLADALDVLISRRS